MTSDTPTTDPLTEALAGLGKPPGPPTSLQDESPQARPRPEVLEAIQRDMAENTRPVRRISRNARIGLSATVLFVGLLVTSVGAMRSDARALLLGGAALSLALGGVLVAAAPGTQERPDLVIRRSIVTLLTTSTLLAVGLMADSFIPLASFFTPSEQVHAAACGTHTLVSGLVCSAGLMFLWRKTDPFKPGLMGALVGAMGGLLGILGTGIACPSHEGWHNLLGHGAAVLILAGLGYLLGRRWLTP